MLRLVTRGTAVGILLIATSCSTPPKQAIVEPIGPVPQVSGATDNSGYLVVYSAWSNFVDQGSTGHHSRYTITADNGSISREIINHIDRFDEGPIQLPLTPGSYHVKARSAHFGRVNVPVVIQPHQTTVVYLDGRRHPEASASQPTSAVKLPDGEIIGWAATTPKSGPQ